MPKDDQPLVEGPCRLPLAKSPKSIAERSDEGAVAAGALAGSIGIALHCLNHPGVNGASAIALTARRRMGRMRAMQLLPDYPGGFVTRIAEPVNIELGRIGSKV